MTVIVILIFKTYLTYLTLLELFAYPVITHTCTRTIQNLPNPNTFDRTKNFNSGVSLPTGDACPNVFFFVSYLSFLTHCWKNCNSTEEGLLVYLIYVHPGLFGIKYLNLYIYLTVPYCHSTRIIFWYGNVMQYLWAIKSTLNIKHSPQSLQRVFSVGLALNCI